MRDASNNILGTEPMSVLPIIGGGFCTGGNMNDAGTVKTHHTDVGGGYVWGPDDTEWRRTVTDLTNANLEQAGGNDYWDSSGVYAQAIAPTSETVGYLHFHGRVYVTIDQFKTITAVPGPLIPGFANGGGHRLWNDKMAIDPVNPRVMILGSEGMGAYYTLDQGATAMTRITAFDGLYDRAGSTRPLPILVAIDRSSASTGTGLQIKKTRYAAFVPTSGVWISTTGPDGTWTKSAGSPTECTHMSFDRDGNLYVVAPSTASVFRLKTGSTTWETEYNHPGFNASFLVIDPKNAQRKFAVDGDNNFKTTYDSGNGTYVWSNDIMRRNYPSNFSYEGNKAAWLSIPTQAYIFPAIAYGDTQVVGRFWMMHGTGVCYFDFPVFGQPFTMKDRSEGNEMLVTIDALWRAGKPPITQNWDKPFRLHVSQNDAPVRYFPPVGVEHGWALDYAAEDPDFLAGIVNYQSEWTGYCTDGGVSGTWTKAAPHPDGYSQGGCLAVESKTKVIWVPANNARAVYSTDGMKSWKYLSLTTSDGVTLPTSGESGWSFAYYFNKRNVIASKETAGTIWLYNYGPSGKEGLRGVWRSTTGVAGTFTQVFAGNFPESAGYHFTYHMKMKEVPGNPNHLFVCSGGDQGGAPFLRSVNGGSVWTRVSTTFNGSSAPISAVQCFGFGKAAPGKTYPAIRFQGTVGSQYGIYETFDNFATVRLVTTRAPLGIPETCSCIVGNPSKFGEWIYGVGQSGWAKSRRQHRLALK